MGHSHVGYIDLAISVGFPGLLLWLAFIGLLMASGWRAYRTGRSIWGLILLFTVAGYAIRCGIDSIIRDHILEEFMFFAGLSAAALATEERAPNNRAGRPSHD